MITTKERTYPENMMRSFMTDLWKMGCPRPWPTVPSIPSKGTEPQSGTGLEDSWRIPIGIPIGIQWIGYIHIL